MKTTLGTLLFILALSASVFAQTSSSSAQMTNGDSTATAKRAPVFKATKDQIMQAQKTLKEKGMLTGEESGKLDEATRASLKKYQTAESMPATGTLNRATLEKMNITLTDAQKAMPDTSAKADSSTMMETKEPKEKKPREAVFRANKDQIMQAQKMLNYL